MAAAEEVKREFSFSLLRPAGELLPGAPDEEILLQGVVDCCFSEPGGLVVVDYKTDRIAPEECESRAGYYRSQIEAYAWRWSGLPAARSRKKYSISSPRAAP